MMSAPIFKAQRAVGEELLAAGWHACSIAVRSEIGSAWVLFDPARLIRVHMRADLTNTMVEVTTTHLPGRPLKPPQWGLTVHQAPVKALIAALLVAPSASEGGTGRDRRVIIGTLAAAGMRPDRSQLARVLSGITVWHSLDRDTEARWTAPYRAEVGGWQIVAPAVHIEATPGTPAAVLAPMITATRHVIGTEARP